MGTRLRLVVAGILVLLWSINAALAQQNDGSAQLGTTFPADFPVIKNYYLGVPVIGFGSNRGPHTHVPVIFLHGNNDTPFPTSCNQFFGHIHDFAQYFRDNGALENSGVSATRETSAICFRTRHSGQASPTARRQPYHRCAHSCVPCCNTLGHVKSTSLPIV